MTDVQYDRLSDVAYDLIDQLGLRKSDAKIELIYKALYSAYKLGDEFAWADALENKHG